MSIDNLSFVPISDSLPVPVAKPVPFAWGAYDAPVPSRPLGTVDDGVRVR